MLDDLDAHRRATPQLRAYTSQAAESRLEVLASDDDPRIGMALDRDDYHRLIGLLDRFYNLILLDTGTGILDSANQGLLTEADQLVLVLRAGLDGGRAAALTLDWLDEHDHGDLVARRRRRHQRGAAGRRRPARADRRALRAPVPPRRHRPLGPGARDRRRRRGCPPCKPETTAALVEVAAAVADGFAADGPVR